MKSLFGIVLMLLISVHLYAQSNVNAYAAFSIQLAQNKKDFNTNANQWKSTYYNSFKLGVLLKNKIAIGGEYSSIIYRWTDRLSLENLLKDEDETFAPTVGEKINNYKIFTQIYPFKRSEFYLGAGWGYSHFRNFRTPDTQKFGNAFSFHAGIELSNYIGFVLSYYNGQLSKYNQHYSFVSYNIGLTISTGRSDKKKKTENEN
jgi:hypothetical protein